MNEGIKLREEYLQEMKPYAKALVNIEHMATPSKRFFKKRKEPIKKELLENIRQHLNFFGFDASGMSYEELEDMFIEGRKEEGFKLLSKII